MASLSVPGTTSWIVTTVANPRARLRLFCVPHAGSGASAYARWAHALPTDVEVCAIQMPGREGRLREPPLTRWDDVRDALAEALRPRTDKPFALFGHSLGALVAFELASRFSGDRSRPFTHLFVSGCRAAHLPLDEAPIHHLPAEELVRELQRSRGTPDEVFESRELLDHFLPTLRADLCLYESYETRTARPEDALPVPISAYGGLEDDRVPAPALQAWRAHTTAAFRHVMFSGGHFFLKEHRAAVLSQLSAELRALVSTIAA
jgi:medium-chain acyl-[acyl-carrier-protein] hydrolase